MTIGYEDLEVGGVMDVGKHTFTPEEIVEFARRYDPQPFHVDEDAGKASPFGGLVASGWHTCSVFMGMLVRNVLHDSTSMGSPGVEEIRWLKPVRAGATIAMQQRILDKRLSASRPDRGIATTEWIGTDESGETVITVRAKVIFGLRNPPENAS